MGNCCSSSATVPSSPLPRPVTAPTQGREPSSSSNVASSRSISGMPAHGAAQHDYELATLSPKYGAATPEHTRSQDPTPSQRRGDDRNEPPPSSGSSPRSHPFQSRGPPLQKSISDATFSQGQRLHSSNRMARTSSTILPGHAPQPTHTQLESELASGTGRMSADRQERQPRFPSTLQSVLPNDFRFKILVAGKPGSGKSSLINTIFNVDMSRASTGITVGFRPRDNSRLIVHECSAFGPGEVQDVRDFITSRQASEKFHAIWICVPMSDVINGQLDNGLRLLLGTGVPLVIVFTMFDLIVTNVPSHGNEYEKARAAAYRRWEGHCRTLFGNVPAEIVSAQPGFGYRIDKLVATTDGVITGHSYNISVSSEAQRTESQMSPVTLAWSVSQRVSRSIKVQVTIEVGKNRYWRRLGSSEDFAGQTLINCVEVIHTDIVEVWNLPDKHRYWSSRAFKVAMSHLIQDQSRPSIGTSSRPRPSGTQETGAAWLDDRYENRNEYICLVAAYIVSLTLVLCGVFGRHGNVSPSGVQSIMDDLAGSSPRPNIHAEICSFLNRVNRFEYKDNDVVLTKIIDLIRQNCESSSAYK